jgi:hypothetical protein
MTTYGELFPSKFASAADLCNGEERRTITDLTMERMRDGRDKPTLRFDHDKPLVLNKNKREGNRRRIRR